MLSEQEISVLRRAALAIHDHFVLNVYEEDNVCAIGKSFLKPKKKNYISCYILIIVWLFLEMEFKIEATEDGSRGGLAIKQGEHRNETMLKY